MSFITNLRLLLEWYPYWSRDSLVGIVTRLRTGHERNRDLIPGRARWSFDQEVILFFKMSILALGPSKSSTQWIAEAPSPGSNQTGHKCDPSSPSCAKFKNERIYASSPPYPFMVYPCNSFNFIPYACVFVSKQLNLLTSLNNHQISLCQIFEVGKPDKHF